MGVGGVHAALAMGWCSCSFPEQGSNLKRYWGDQNYGPSYLEGVGGKWLSLFRLLLLPYFALVWRVEYGQQISDGKACVKKRLAFVQLVSGVVWRISLLLRGVRQAAGRTRTGSSMLSVPWDYSVDKQVVCFNEREMNTGTLAVMSKRSNL